MDAFFAAWWGGRGRVWHPFGVSLDVLGVQMGFFLKDFEGLVLLGRLGRPVGATDPMA